MPTERWRQVEELFAEAIEQPVHLRALFLTTCGESDACLRDDVTSLLQAAEQSCDFLAAPALDGFARQISREGWTVRPGDRIAAYTIAARLGAGGMGEVWRARDDRRGRDVAIKLLLPHAGESTSRVRAFEREARAAGAVNHANVLTLYDVGNHGGMPYLVSECLEGEPLRARLRGSALPLDEALEIMVQAARGLDAAHARGIVHRDLKPENIFLTSDGRVKILDFGLATIRESASGSSDATCDHEPPAQGLAGGTAGYMAPEQIQGEDVDSRADIFALGAVLYEMLTGTRAFQGASAADRLNAVLTKDPGDPSALNPRLPRPLSQLVRRCLAKSPADRFARVGDVIAALEDVVHRRRVRAAYRKPKLKSIDDPSARPML